jgi:hypothetical protein
LNTQYKKAKKFVFCAFFNNYSNLIDKKRRFLVSKAFETSKAGARRFFILGKLSAAGTLSATATGTAAASGTAAGVCRYTLFIYIRNGGQIVCSVESCSAPRFILSATATARPSSPFPSGAVSSGTGAGCFMNTRRARRRRFFILSDKRKRMQTNDNGHGCSLRNGGGLFLHPGHTIRRRQRARLGRCLRINESGCKRRQTISHGNGHGWGCFFIHGGQTVCNAQRGAPVVAVPVWGWGCLRIVAAAVA